MRAAAAAGTRGGPVTPAPPQGLSDIPRWAVLSPFIPGVSDPPVGRERFGREERSAPHVCLPLSTYHIRKGEWLIHLPSGKIRTKLGRKKRWGFMGGKEGRACSHGGTALPFCIWQLRARVGGGRRGTGTARKSSPRSDDTWQQSTEILHRLTSVWAPVSTPRRCGSAGLPQELKCSWLFTSLGAAAFSWLQDTTPSVKARRLLAKSSTRFSTGLAATPSSCLRQTTADLPALTSLMLCRGTHL